MGKTSNSQGSSTSRTSPSRTALVTGATSGIGEAISLRLLDEGHRVLGLARRPERFKRQGANFVPLAIDLEELDQLPQRLKTIADREPAIDTLICSAGRGDFGALEEFSYQRIRSLIDLNLTAQVCLVRAFLPHFKRQGHGDVILIGSEAGLSAGRRGALYSATKFAIRGLAQALRQECARRSVRICVINPGMVQTPFFDELNFEPGPHEDNALMANEVADAVMTALSARRSAVFDEINLSPLKHVVRFRRNEGE